MRARCPARCWVTILILAIATFLITASTNYPEDWWPLGKKTKRSKAPVVIDSKPLPEAINVLTSIAPMIHTVGPGVVNVFSTNVRRSADERQLMPFFNQSFFRQFINSTFNASPQGQLGLGTPKERSLGSGVIVSTDGYILTNHHVVDGADEILVAISEDHGVFAAEIVGTDPKTDIAVLKVDAEGLPTVTLGNSAILEVGDFVVAVGNPFGMGQSVTSGIVSAIGRDNSGTFDDEDFIQTDASINPNNSGGALVDVQGRLIGINTAIVSRNSDNHKMGFAVSINLAKSVMERLLKHGRVARGDLGVSIQNVTEELSKAFNLPRPRGVIVADVTQGSAADIAGIINGDIIVGFAGSIVEDVQQLRLMVARTTLDIETTLNFIRDGELMELIVQLQELPGPEEESAEKKSEYHYDDELLIGIIVAELHSNIRERSGMPPGINGALVIDVKSDAPADKAGLKSGDIIMEIDRVPVNSAKEAIKASRMIKKDSVLLHIWNDGGARYLVVKNPNEEE